MKHVLFFCLLLVSISLISCNADPDSPRGFSLPKGNIDKGKEVLIKYQCLACHHINSIDQPEGINNPDINVRLGGESTMIKTYAELVTSVINPSHKFALGYPAAAVSIKGKSKMKNFNDLMTVTELIDLVTFLQPQYKLAPYRRSSYQVDGY